MKNLYYGDILKCKDPIKKEKGILHLGGVYLVEIKENKFVLLEELLSSQKEKQILNTYSFKKGELYVDYTSLVNINDVMTEKYGRKLK